MRFNTSKVLIMAALLSIGVTACTTNMSSNTYSTSGATQMQRVVAGTIVSARQVQIADDQNAIGSLGGAALGGLAGAQIGHGAGSTAGAIGGALIGGLIGNQIEKQVTKQMGMEYVVKLKNGAMVSVVQGTDPMFYRGQHVMVVYGGGRPRVIPAA